MTEELCLSCIFDDFGYCRADDPTTECEYGRCVKVIKCDKYVVDIYRNSGKYAPKDVK